MEHGELVRRLLATFVVELGEHATALQRDLLALEQAAGPARAGLVDALFRTAHTVKGAARAAGVEAIERAAGAVEELLAQARDGARTVDAGAVNLLLEVVDALADAGAALDQGRPLDGRAITRVQPRLDAMAHGGGEVGGPAEPVAPGPQPAQAAVGDRLDAVAELAAELLEQVDRLPAHAGVHRLARRLAEAIDDLRLVPLAGATLGLERAVRDLAVTLGKRVTLTIEGTELELDPTVVAGLRDPLLHLIRNAVDHGLEAPADRVAAGKPATGRITVSARLAGDRIEVAVTDDGRGLDRPALGAALARRGLDPAADDAALAEAAFRPGLSTARMVTDVSGRGVGLDAVRAQVEALRGTAELERPTAGGLRAVLRIPRSLARLRVMIVEVAGQRLAIPEAPIERVVRAEHGALRPVGGRESLIVGDGPVPVVALATTLGLGPPATGDRLVVVVLAAGGRRVGLAVERVLAGREVSLRSLGERARGVRHVLGAATVDGQPVVVLDAAEVLRRALTPSTPSVRRPEVAEDRRPQILLADDSMTTRTLERIILEGAGYDVTVAVDGAEAWQRVQEQPFDLVVSDVEMPGLDGVGLCERIRATPRLAELPVVLVTALGRDRDRARGLAAGADAYVVKGAFDQQGLLDIISRLLP